MLAVSNKKHEFGQRSNKKTKNSKILQFCLAFYRAIWDKGVWPWGDF